VQTRRFLATCLVLGAVSLPEAPVAGKFEDPQHGYAIRVPKGWSGLPATTGRPEQVALFYSLRGYGYTPRSEDGMGWPRTAHPELRVLVFPREPEDAAAAGGDGLAAYTAYLDRDYGVGRWQVREQAQGRVSDLSFLRLSIAIAHSQDRESRFVETAVYTLPEVHVALHFDLVEDVREKARKEVESVIRSFREIPVRAAPEAEPAAAALVLDLEALQGMSMDARAEKRREHEAAVLAWLTARLPEGWKVETTPACHVVSPAGSRTRKLATRFSQATQQWLAGQFPEVGPGEQGRRPILVLCPDWSGAAIYQRGLPPGEALVIVSSESSSGAVGWETGRICRDVARLWFLDRDPDLYFGLPEWLRAGLLGMLKTASLDRRGGLDFHGVGKSSSFALAGVRERMRSGRALSAREILEAPPEAFRRDPALDSEAAALLRFLMVPERPRRGGYAEVFPRYMVAVRQAVDGLRERVAAAAREHEDYEKAPWTARIATWREHRQEIGQAALRAAFGDWDMADWLRLDKAYRASVR